MQNCGHVWVCEQSSARDVEDVEIGPERICNLQEREERNIAS